MGIKEIQTHYIITCDGCHTETQEKTSGRPTGWARLTLERAALDYRGSEAADATVKAMLCSECSAKVANAINRALGDKP